MTAIALAPGLYWVGAIDWNVRDFHGYATPRGTTYNAYLVVDEKIALVDTVKPPFCQEMLDRIRQVVDPANIDYVIANHAEMDHSGCLPQVMEIARNATLVTSQRFGEQALEATYHAGWSIKPVKEGDSISLGKRTLQFFLTPMLHWPDSMATYIPEQSVLLPNDAFGQHLATSQRFDDEVGLDVVMAEAAMYYAEIIMPYGDIVLRTLKKLEPLDIKMIGPSHGVVWRSHVKDIWEACAAWGRGQTKPKVVVAYDSMWGSTDRMARALVDGIISEGVEVKLCNLAATHRSEVVKEVLEARVLAVGTPTLNNGMFPTVADFLCFLKGLKPKGKIGLAFGSYGWGGGGTKAVKKELEEAGVQVLDEELSIRYVPDGEALGRCFEMGRALARRAREG